MIHLASNTPSQTDGAGDPAHRRSFNLARQACPPHRTAESGRRNFQQLPFLEYSASGGKNAAVARCRLPTLRVLNPLPTCGKSGDAKLTHVYVSQAGVCFSAGVYIGGSEDLTALRNLADLHLGSPGSSAAVRKQLAAACKATWAAGQH